MDFLVQRARQAMETALERSKEQAEHLKGLAVEASKRADQIRDFAVDGAGKVKASFQSSEERDRHKKELERYGITSELRDFVQGLTFDTFRDFPVGDEELYHGFSEVLSPWKERHALLVLSAVPEISDLRYKLCPKHIKDKRFWRIYFTVVNGHIAKYEEQNLQQEQTSTDNVQAEETRAETVQAQEIVEETVTDAEIQERHSAELPKSTMSDKELDDYLLGALDNSDDEQLEDDGRLDAEFEQLVNDTTLDSSDEEKHG